jgi:hypothetical protein
MQITDKLWFVHKYNVSQQYGGPEEGGWWYDAGYPDDNWIPLVFTNEEEAYARCRELNKAEYERRKEECPRGYTSVLSYEEEFYTYDVTDEQKAYPFPEVRPHYE